MSANKKSRKSRRTEEEIRSDIMNAVGAVLQQYGIAKLGINLVAEKADIDKKVIYRKYGTFDNLLAEYIDTHDYWLTTLPQKNYHEINDLRAHIKSLVIFSLYPRKIVLLLKIEEMAEGF
jgi:AcrR family transcriptional regulator